MDNQPPDAVRMKQTRLTILSYLNRLYPTPLQVCTLFRVLLAFDETYSLSLLTKDVTYLKQKGYVEFVDDKIGGFEHYNKKFVGLTAEGKEIADRTATDEALEI